MSRTLFLTDIHGCARTFEAMLHKISLQREDQLILLGDYVDRGPDSKGVIDRIERLRRDRYQVVALQGNHEEMLLANYRAEKEEGWFDMADPEFNASFGIASIRDIPIRYVNFCRQLPYSHVTADFIAVHAGLNFQATDPLEPHEDQLWIREWYKDIDYNWLGPRCIIHGHTPLTREEIEAQFTQFETQRTLNLDCGACMAEPAQKAHGLGYLCGFDFTNRQLYFQENVE